MCDTIEVKSASEVYTKFAELLAARDFYGALGVAQVMWCFCGNAIAFQVRRSHLLVELTSFKLRTLNPPHEDVEQLGRQLLQLEFVPSEELVPAA
jgi:hypothetical protein